MHNLISTVLFVMFYWSVPSVAQIHFFEGEINYWDNRKRSTEKSVKPEKDPKKFDWKPYHDPSYDTFFREGNHLPPKPFIELVRNPSDENIRNWFRYIEMKNHLSDRLSRRLAEFAGFQSPNVAKALKTAAQDSNAESRNPDYKRFRIRYYFDPECPHCKKMFKTMETMQKMGFYIEARQVTAGYSKPQTSLVINMASKDELEQHQISAVPFLLIGDLQTKRVFRLAGFRDVSAVLRALEEVKIKQ